MKRGRPSKRNTIHKEIMSVLGEMRTPMTTSALGRLVSERTNSSVSWNTIQKYLRELIETNKVEPMILPHSKETGKDGLTVYTIKK
jgi:hypothetical protein